LLNSYHALQQAYGDNVDAIRADEKIIAAQDKVIAAGEALLNLPPPQNLAPLLPKIHEAWS